MRWSDVGVLALVVAIGLSTPARAVADAGYHEVVYAVVVNGEQVSDGTILLSDDAGDIAVATEDLLAWRLVLPRAEPILFKGKPYFPLSAFARMRVNFDAAKQTLSLIANPLGLAPSDASDITLGNGPQAPTKQVAASARGYYLDYDLHAQSAGGGGANALLTGGTALGSGAFTTSLLVGSANGGAGIEPLNTVWQHDDLVRHTSLRIGDGVASAGGVFGGGVLFTGVQYGTNFATEPGLAVAPVNTVRGSAELPSTLDVYVNNVLTATENVPPGPFSISNLPSVGGQAQVRLVIQDVQGRSQTVSSSYYSGANLLAAGLTDSSWASGFLRNGAGTFATAYGDFFAQVTRRHGFSGHFTGEVDAEYAPSDERVSLAGNWLLGGAGTLAGGVSSSASSSGGGVKGSLSYGFTQPRLSLGVSADTSSPNYREVGALSGLGTTRDVLTYASFAVTRTASVGFTYGEEYRATTGDVRVSTIRLSGKAAGGSFTIAAASTPGTSGGRDLQVQFFRPLGRLGQIVSTVDRSSGGTVPGLGFSQGTTDQTSGASYSFDAEGGPSPYLQALVSRRRPTNELQAGLSTIGGSTSLLLDFSGALGEIDGHHFFTRQIGQSYGLAELPGYPNVRVRVGGADVGSTDSEGYIALPRLQPYLDNTIELDSATLPLSANVGGGKETVVPRFGVPALVRFEAARAGGVQFHLVDDKGAPIPAGASARADDAKEWPVANEGFVYVAGLSAGAHTIRSTTGSAPCEASIVVPASTADIPDLGTVTCR